MLTTKNVCMPAEMSRDVRVLDLNRPEAAIMLKKPSLWNHTSSNSSTIADLKAELVNKQLVRSLPVDLALCTDPTTNKWTYESDFSEVDLPDGNLYVRAAPAPADLWSWFTEMRRFHKDCQGEPSVLCMNRLWGWLSRNAGWLHLWGRSPQPTLAAARDSTLHACMTAEEKKKL
jgi:hypothetical protein